MSKLDSIIRLNNVEKVGVMRRLAALASSVVLFFVMSACSPLNSVWKDESTSSVPNSSKPKVRGEIVDVFDSFSYLVETDEFNNVIHQYGNTDSIIEYGDDFSCSISYPVGGLSEPDECIKNWAADVKNEFFSDAREFTGRSGGTSELTVNYNSYIAKGSYAGIKEMGWFESSHMAHPMDIVYVQNIDLGSGKTIDSEDIFTDSGKKRVTGLLKNAVSELAGDSEASCDVDESWLKYSVLTDKGVEIILPRGEFLAASMGTHVFCFPYEKVQGALSIVFDKKQYPSAQPSPQPAGEPEEPDAKDAPDVSIDPSRPMVALTFDDGPSETTPHILDILKQAGGRATFCVLGSRINSYSDTVRRTVDEGSEIATHTWDHKKLSTLYEQDAASQMSSVCDAVKSITGGYEVKFVRPPYGSVNDTVKAAAASEGLSVANWSVDTLDWKTKDPQSTFEAVKKDLKDGCIILCHDLYGQTGEAMEQVIPYIVSQGYQLVTLSELIYYKQGGAQPGELYRHG